MDLFPLRRIEYSSCKKYAELFEGRAIASREVHLFRLQLEISLIILF